MRKLIAIALIFVSTICNAQNKLDSVTVFYDSIGNITTSKYYTVDTTHITGWEEEPNIPDTIYVPSTIVLKLNGVDFILYVPENDPSYIYFMIDQGAESLHIGNTVWQKKQNEKSITGKN